MVEFTRMQLTGFKSFVEPAEFLMEKGMTGIVGPNGCGKSNLVEALRWVMGETSAKQLRGGEMDEVIFGGTDDRPARNIAEVNLFIDNSARTASSQFNDTDELEVSRKIERGKGSIYKINGRDVRAKDIQLLFADLSSGARSTALVSQGKVGEIINAKPTQRRHLLEEAANITGLHGRKHEAELKLKAADLNLNRLEDLSQALSTQLQSLKKQARQASRYRTISDSIKTANALVLTIQKEVATELFKSALGALEEAKREVNQKTSLVAQKTSSQIKAAEVMPGLRTTEAEKAAVLQRLSLARKTLDTEEGRLESAQKTSQQRLETLQADLKRETDLIKDAEDMILGSTKEKKELKKYQSERSDHLENARERLKTSAESVHKIEFDLADLASTLGEQDAIRAAAKQKMEESKLRGIRALRQLEEIEQQLEDARSQSQPMLDLQTEETAVSRSEQLISKARNKWESAEKECLVAQEKNQIAQEVRQQALEEEAKASAEARALEGLLTDSSKQETWVPIVESITIKDGFEPALGAAMGDDLEGADCEPAPIQWSLLSIDTPVPGLPSGVSPITNIVTAPESLKFSLSQIGLIEDATIGSEIQKHLKPGQKVVTKDGDLWRWDGFTKTAAAPASSAQKLKNVNRLRIVKKQLEVIGTKTKKAIEEAQTSKLVVSEQMTIERQKRNSVREAEEALSAARLALSERQRISAAIESRITSLNETKKTMIQECHDAGNQEKQSRELLTSLDNQNEGKSAQKNLQTKLAESRNQLMDSRAKFDELSRTAEQKEQRLKELEDAIHSWSNRINDSKVQYESLKTRENAALAELKEMEAKPADFKAQRQILTESLDSADKDRAQAADRLQEAEVHLTEITKKQKHSEQEAAISRENRVREEANVEQSKQTLQIIDNNISEKIGCEPSQIRTETRLKENEEPPALEKAERSLARLISERENMGAINLRAEEETQKLSQEIDTLDNERADLIDAIERLREGISTLNREGRQRLKESFIEVDSHFQTLFNTLFGGGKAYLSLTESEDPLAAGLEVMASPPGKRLQNLTLLSGGEQALTAIALLFAVFMVNPAPICVLDEVDAPLDDANVDRFCKLIDKITQTTGTRVILVTHHRMTMARVDRLFGVTMAEKGVSKLVSVNLQKVDTLKEITKTS